MEVFWYNSDMTNIENLLPFSVVLVVILTVMLVGLVIARFLV